MGGFVTNVPELDSYLNHGYLTLTCYGIRKCAQRGKFFEINESEIIDKSKADILAKGLVCLQVTWMMVQCIARKVAGYPLTILEVHTFAHVCCALLMYVFWFKVSLFY